MSISESLHADPSLTAVAVILIDILGAITVTPLMNRMGITDFRARGFAVGIAMSLNALVTSLLVPLAVTFLLR